MLKQSMRRYPSYRQRLQPRREQGVQGEQTAYSPRTDLAVEAHELARRGKAAVRGIDEEREELDGVTVSRVTVRTAQAARKIGKPKGTYITIESQGLRRRDPELQERVARQFAQECARLFSVPMDASILVVGLGNVHVTPDSLGPLVVDSLFVTRHLFRYLPETLGDGYRSVSAIAPGVLGITGIETGEVVRGLVNHVKPDLVIAVDALASRSLNRVNATIQLSNTGIQPGAGVGNKRQAIDEATLGVPCIAIGVPTVVDAATIANDAIDLVLRELHETAPGNGANQIFDQFTVREKWQMVTEVLEPLGNNLMVTPKEIDEFVDDVAHVVAQGLNCALHPAMEMEDAAMVTH